MVVSAGSFSTAGAGLEAQRSEGLGKIKAAQAALDAATLIQAESARNTFAKLLEHDANMHALNEQNISRMTAKFEEIEAARTAATAAIDRLQRRDDWQGQSLGQPNTGMPPAAGGGPGAPMGYAGAGPNYDWKKLGLCNAKTSR